MVALTLKEDKTISLCPFDQDLDAMTTGTREDEILEMNQYLQEFVS